MGRIVFYCKDAYLHGFVTSANVSLVDEDIGDGFLARHFQQQSLIVGTPI